MIDIMLLIYSITTLKHDFHYDYCYITSKTMQFSHIALLCTVIYVKLQYYTVIHARISGM